MPQFTYSDLADPGNSSIVKKVGSGVQGAVCNAYHNYKDWYHQNIDIGSPAGEILENFWDNICPGEPPYTPPPPPPGPGFSGGQCACDIYTGNVRFRYTYYGTEYSELTSFTAAGPIAGFGSALRPDGNTDLFVIGGDCVNGQVVGTKNFGYYICVPSLHYVGAKFESIYKKFGGADNCGNPPAPPSPPPPAPPDVINDNITIINNDGINVDIPISFSPQISMPDLNINTQAFVFKPDISFSPQFNINQPPGGSTPPPPPSLNFDFGPDGISVTVGPGGSSPSSNSNFILNNKLDSVTNKIDTDVIVDINLLKDKLDSADDCCPEPPDPDTQTAIVCPIDDGNTYTGIKDLASVKLDVTKLPLSSKIQFGNGSPNVLFAGWLAFTFEGQAYEREPIHFQHNLFTPPKGANGFFYCLTNGAKGRVTYYIKT